MVRHQGTVCHVLHSLAVGGAEILAARLARQLDKAFHFLFVCLDELGALGRKLRNDGYSVFVINRRPGIDWDTSRRIADVLRREKVDLLHAHQYTPWFYSMIARLLYRRPPVLFTEHGRWFPDYPRRKRIFVNRLVLERRDRVVGVGESVRQALIENEGIPSNRVETIYNGVELTRFSTAGSSRLAARREIGVGHDDLVIVQVARLDALKDHCTALRTIARVRARRSDVRHILVGEGPELPLIQRKVAEWNLSENVRLLGLRDDVFRVLAAADLFLLTSVSEGIPLTVIEAMAAGLPVVSTRVGGVPEVVDDGHTGLLAPAGDDAALAEKILELAANVELRARMGRLGCERAWANFSEQRMHEGYLRLYREMLNGSNGRCN